MRNDWRARAAVLLGSVLAVSGCSTTQPGSQGTRTASLSIIAKADMTVFNCYEIWADDINGIPVYQEFNECYAEINQQTGLPVVANRNVPWRYSLSVSIIHRDSTTEEIATSLSGLVGSSIQPGDNVDNFISLSAYDPTDQPADFRPPEIRPSYGLVQFLNGKKVSRGSPFWLGTNGFELGDPNILSASPTFDFEVDSGDTVVVRARKQLKVDAADFLQAAPPPKITLSGTLSVGGSSVSPSGTTTSSDADGAGISFSFTVQ
jgi:hypothetical protein